VAPFSISLRKTNFSNLRSGFAIKNIANVSGKLKEIHTTLRKLTIALILSTVISCTESRIDSPLLDNLTPKDTVTLFAQYSECGEWGGHIEKIYLTKEEDQLRATLYKDTMVCVSGPDFGKRTKLPETSKVLTIKERNKVIRYIDTFFVATKLHEFPDANASYHFQILTKDSIYEYLNWKRNWKEFNKLSKDIFVGTLK